MRKVWGWKRIRIWGPPVSVPRNNAGDWTALSQTEKAAMPLEHFWPGALGGVGLQCDLIRLINTLATASD